MRIWGICIILIHFVAWRSLGGKSYPERSRNCLEAETEKKAKWKAKLWNDESSNLPASSSCPEASWVVWFPQRSPPRKAIYFCSSWEHPGCFFLPQSSLMYLTHMHTSKFSNGYEAGERGGGDVTFTSTETRWAAKKGRLADFWNGFWEVVPPTSGVRTPRLQSSGLGSHPRGFGGLYDF